MMSILSIISIPSILSIHYYKLSAKLRLTLMPTLLSIHYKLSTKLTLTPTLKPKPIL